jgi:membrane-bound lytic murein transglycosylase D
VILNLKGPAATILLLLAACHGAPSKPVRVITPTQPLLLPGAAPIPSEVGSSIQAKPKIDPVGLIIVEARLRFEHGEELYKQGFLQRSKSEFDGALDLLLDSAAMYPNNPRLDREITEMAGRVHVLELAAFKDGDGFTDQRQERAAIDDLENITTFPTPIDPKFKKELEQEIAEFGHDLPIEVNDRVLAFLGYYQKGRGRTTIEIGLERVGKYQSMIEQILKEEGLPLDLIYLCQAESAFVPRALSRASAKGMWQFISSRGKEYGLRQNWWIDERSDPEKSTRAAARHLKDLYEEFGDWYLAMAAYNSGPLRVQRALDRTGGTTFWNLADKKALPKETMNYVPTILALTIIGKNPEKYGFSVAPAPPIETERVSVNKATDLRVIAEALHLSVDELKDLNPHVLRWTTPPADPEFELILPKGYAQSFKDQVAGLPESERVLFRRHTVQRNETLSTVARKYGTTSSVLSQANNLPARKALKVGQELIIPMSGVGPAKVAAVTNGRAATAAAASSRTPFSSNSSSGTYTVKRGDTLGTIAARYAVTAEQLREWNQLPTSGVTAGKKLVVVQPSAPPATAQTASDSGKKVIHKVRRGETLNAIASAYKTTVGAIVLWNKKNDLTVIHPGDLLTIFLGNR